MLIRPRPTVLLLAVAVTGLAPLLGRYCFDLDVYRMGGRAVLHGRPLYAQRIGPYGFTYPPFAALLAAPLAVLPYGAASAVLAAGSLGGLGIVLRRSGAELLAARSGWGFAALVALACCAPVRGTFWNGQVNLLLAAVVLADLRRRPGGRRCGGIGVGVAAAIKLTPAVFVLYLLVCGRRREAANATAAFAAVTAWAWLVLPGDSARFWFHQIVSGSGIGDEARTSNQSLHGLVLRLVGPGGAGAVWLPLAGTALVVGLRSARRLARKGRETFAIGVVGVTGCLVSPVSWVHHWVWAVPWLVGLAQAARRPAAVAWVAVVGTVVVGWDQLPLGALPRWPALTFVAQNDLVLCAVATGLTGVWAGVWAGVCAGLRATVPVPVPAASGLPSPVTLQEHRTESG